MTWPLVPLGDVLLQSKKYIDAPEAKTYPKLSVKLYGKGVILDVPTEGASLKMRRHQLAKAGQVILSEIWGKKGAIGFVPQEGEGALCTSHFFLFDVKCERLLPKWLEYIFKANYLQEQLDSEAKGTTGYAAVRPAHLLKATIPLPPLAEQRRLVARIDALAAKIEEAKRLREAARLEAESFIPARTAQILGNLEGELVTISQVADVRGGIQKSPDRVPGNNPVRYLTVAHVHRDRIRLEEPRYFEVRPSELDRWRLMAGDVLIIEGNGSADQIGRTALFRGEIDPCVHQNHVIRIRPDQERAYPDFLNLYLNSPVGQDAVQARSRTTSGLRSLSVGRIKEIKIRLPDIPAQQRVVQSVLELRNSFQRVIDTQGTTANELNALLPAILDRAFREEM